ncbi:MAG: TetR/AcrR family transcriptional regulator [Rhodospirillum sp.]|nr:TetR/AcrR family transcriptional regulator [Rhodospirillum sp.]MCF8489177.1 TetR/AcrR family transcriptional regulator [Rhodospirillum sp.]MCF8501345.1 TetR/AcrR family transcriptional regulator [Rhodospirillum sp.]
MARTRAANYDEKRLAILKRAAEVFSKEGFDRASMSGLAQACGVSKALLYHYYTGKDELLFDVIGGHLEELCALVDGAFDPGLPPRERLLALVTVILEGYRDSTHEHRVQINALSQLPDDQQEELRTMERHLVRVVAGAIEGVDPRLAGKKDLLKPLTMSLFGMLNWHYMWFRQEGPLTREDYAQMATTITIAGARAVLGE